MVDSCDSVIRSLELHSSRINKEDILRAQIENTELFEGFNLALSPYITFGIKQVPIKPSHTTGRGLSWQAFKSNLQRLINREITGNAARDLIEDLMDHSTEKQWNDWYRRILIKDLRCGVSEKTVNKIKKNAVQVFACMLAHDAANHESKLQGKKLLEPKLDGVRVITIINTQDRTVTQYSRNGKILENFNHIVDKLQSMIDNFDRSWVLDGEIVSNSFQDLMKQVHRKEDVQANDARLMLFDILPLSEFKRGYSSLGQKRRSALLKSFKPLLDQVGFIDIIEQLEIDFDSYVGELEYKEYNKLILSKGFEGIMIKSPDAIYECKRSANWLKQKPFIEVSLAVQTVEEGTGRNQGKLGALVCQGQDDGKEILVNVGSGFTDQDRDEFWVGREQLRGQVVEVRADAITQNQDGTFSLRFPRFLRFRGFTVGEKI